MINNSERHNRLDTMIREGRIIRHAWTKSHDRACLLAALSPEAGAAGSAAACPAEVMPPWLAHLTPFIDDEPSTQAWPSIVARYAALARRWGALDSVGWERARIGALIAIVGEARRHVAPECASVLQAIDGVLAWLRRGAPESEREAAHEAARAARAAGWADAWAAWAAGTAAAWPAAESAVRAYGADRLSQMMEGSAEAVRSAAHEAASAAAARAAARAAAADRIATGVLDAIEREIERTEAR